MKILLVHNYPLRTGGIAVLNFELAQFLKNKGWEVKIFSPAIKENLDFTENNLEHLKKLIFESDLTILNPSPYLWPSILKSFFYLKKFEKKFLVWFHIILDSEIYEERYGKNEYLQRFKKLAEILNSDSCLKIICVSKAVKEFLKEVVINQEKLEVIYPGIKVFSYRNSNKKKDLIYAGRFSEEKNLGVLIRAFAKVSQKIKNINLTLIGEGDTENDLKKLIDKLKIKNRVNFLNYVSQKDLHRLIIEHKFLINPSKVESLSLITIESLLLKTPVILSKNPGHLEVTQNGKFSIIFDPYNENELFKKIIYGLENYSKIKNKTEKATEILKRKFAYEKNWNKYEEIILESVLNKPVFIPKLAFDLSSAFVL